MSSALQSAAQTEQRGGVNSAKNPETHIQWCLLSVAIVKTQLYLKKYEKIMKYQWDDVVFVASCKRPERKEAGSRDGGC